jgi:hypothetical protein
MRRSIMRLVMGILVALGVTMLAIGVIDSAVDYYLGEPRARP